MNSPDSNNSPEPIPTNSSLTPISEGNESPIEAEIVEDLSKSKKHRQERSLRIVRHSLRRREKQATVSIVTISLPEGEYIAEAQRINPAQKPKPTWLDNFVTPWGIAGLLMLLSANILLSYAQWSNSQQVAQAPKPSKTLTPPENSPSLSIPDSLNLALENPDRLTLDSLSTIAPNTNIATTPIAPQQPIAATPTPTLSNVLLPPPAPPMAQSQPVQTVPPVQTYSAPPTAPIAPVSPSQPPLPPPPVPQAANVMPANERSPLETIPTFSNNSDRLSEFSQRHRAEQKRQEMENLPSLSFNQKVRSDRLSRQNQLDPNRTRQQFQQRQREQIEQQLPIADNQQSSPTNEIVIQQQPATTNREDIEQQLPPAPPQAQPLSNNSKPTVEMNNDGSVEIRSNSLR
jgi:hypothetical protein